MKFDIDRLNFSINIFKVVHLKISCHRGHTKTNQLCDTHQNNHNQHIAQNHTKDTLRNEKKNQISETYKNIPKH